MNHLTLNTSYIATDRPQHHPAAKPGKLRQLINKIVTLIKKIWRAICFWKKDVRGLSQTSLDIINSKLTSKQNIKVVQPKKVQNKATPADSGDKTPAPTQSQEDKTPSNTSPLGTLLTDFMKYSVNTAYEHKLKKGTEAFEKGVGNKTKQLQRSLGLLVKIGSIAKTQFERFTKDSSKIDSALKRMLDILIDPDLDGELNREKSLQERIKAKMPPGSVHHQNILNWLLDKDRKGGLDGLKSKLTIQEKERFDRIFKEVLECLIEDKLQNFVSFFQNTFDGKFSDTMRQTILTNATMVTDKLSNRLEELLDNTEFQKVFDDIVKTVCSQTEGQLKGAEAKKEPKSLTSKKTTKKPHTELTYKEYTKQIKNLERILEDTQRKKQTEAHKKAASAKKILESQMARNKQVAFYEAFAATTLEGTSTDIHQTILDIAHLEVSEEMGKTMSEKSNYSQRLEVALNEHKKKQTEQLVTRLFELLLPQDQGGIRQIWKHLKPGPALEKLIKYGRPIVEELIPERFLKGLGNVLHIKLTEKLEDSIIHEAETRIQVMIQGGIKKLIDRIIDPSQLKSMVAELLPSITDAAFDFFVEQAVFYQARDYKGRKPKKRERGYPAFNLTGHLCSLLKSKNEEEKKKNRENILTLLLETTRRSLNQGGNQNPYSLKEHGLSSEQFKKRFLPFVEKIENQLKDKFKNPTEVETDHIEAELKNIYESQNDDNNPVYGELLMNAAFEIGELKKTSRIASFFSPLFKETISKAITGGLAPYRGTGKQKPYEKLLTLGIEAARSSLLPEGKEKESIENLLYGKKEKSNKPEDILNRRIKKMSRIVRILIFRLEAPVTSSGFKKGPVNKVLPSEEEIESATRKIIDKLLGDRLMNFALVLRTQSIAISSLEEAAKIISSSDQSGTGLSKTKS